MDNINVEQAKAMAESKQDVAVEKEKDANSAEASYGKFKDVQSLVTAYNNLEAEFTKRCQKLRELEAKLSVVDKEESPTETELTGEDLSRKEKDDILKDYLKDLLSKKQRAIVLDGTGLSVKTPTSRPKTIEQAGELAKQLLIKKL